MPSWKCWLFTSGSLNLLLVGRAKVTAGIKRVGSELISRFEAVTKLRSLDDSFCRIRGSVFIFVFLALNMVPAHGRCSISVC